MEYREAAPEGRMLETLIELSEDWERENITYEYQKNEPEDVTDKRVFVAEENGEVVAFLLGHTEGSKNRSSIIPDGAPCFWVDELYVTKPYRGRGIGRELLARAEGTAKMEGAAAILLVATAKNYRPLLHFYIDEVGLDFFSAILFRRL